MLALFIAVTLWWRHRLAVALLGFVACVVAGLLVTVAAGGAVHATGARPEVWGPLVLLARVLAQVGIYVAIDQRAVPGPRNPTFAVPVALLACVLALVVRGVLH